MTNVNGIANPGASINNNHSNLDVISPAEFNALSIMGGAAVTPISTTLTSTAAISTAIVSSANVVAGLYQVNVYYATTTAGTSNNSDTISLFYTDRDTAATQLLQVGVANQTSLTVPVVVQGTETISVAATSAISYVVSHSNGSYGPTSQIRIAMRQLA